MDTPERLAEKCAERKKKRPKTKMGRPVGGNLINNAIMNISAADQEAIFQTLVKVAKDPDHKNFGHASKILTDRLAHISHFEKDKAEAHKGGITINIQGITKAEVIEDGEFTEV
jgi:hypothetical protein